MCLFRGDNEPALTIVEGNAVCEFHADVYFKATRPNTTFKTFAMHMDRPTTTWQDDSWESEV